MEGLPPNNAEASITVCQTNFKCRLLIQMLLIKPILGL